MEVIFMTILANPFSLAFGREPKNLINRFIEFNQIIDDFKYAKDERFAYIITGSRGSGKTVLLSSVLNYFRQDNEWIVVDIVPQENILENLATEIYNTAKLKRLFLKKELTFTFHGLSLKLSGGEEKQDIISIIKIMIKYLSKKGKKVLIGIDEVTNKEYMKNFISTFQLLSREQLPVYLLMTGLYDNVSKLQDDKSLTFLYRAPKIYLGPLSLSAITNSYQSLLNVNFEKAKEFALFTKGYAYAYQVLGSILFKKADKIIDNEVINEFDLIMKETVYDKSYSELTEVEKNIVSCIPKDEIKISELLDLVHYDKRKMSVYRDRLIKKGIINSPRFGYLEFVLPRFYEYITFSEY